MPTQNALPRVPIVDMFQSPKGREYTLVWANSTKKSEMGIIRMTDLLFNYYFYPTAFGLDGAMDSVTIPAKGSITVVREIGKAGKTYSRDSYTVRRLPTYRSGAYDSGTQMFAIDGKDVWNFEISGRVTEFRIWMQNVASTNNLKRPAQFETITGVGIAVAPLTSAAVI
jgi:hypothetical protein